LAKSKAKVIVSNEQWLEDIADAVREKTQTNKSYRIDEIPEAIMSIPDVNVKYTSTATIVPYDN